MRSASGALAPPAQTLDRSRYTRLSGSYPAYVMSIAGTGERVAIKTTEGASLVKQAVQRQSSEQADMDVSPCGLPKVIPQGF